MVDYTDYIAARARAYGIDPNVALKVARAEGGTNRYIQSNVMKGSLREPSYGPFQMLVGGEGTGFPEGMGNQMIRETGVDPRNEANAPAAIDFALKQASQKGWGQWYGAKAVGLDTWDGIKTRGLSLTSSPQQLQPGQTAAPPLPDPRTITDRPIAEVQPDAPAAPSDAPGLFAQLKEGDFKGALGTLKEGIKDAAAGDGEDDDGAAGWASALTGTGKAQSEQDRENANIAPSQIGAQIAAMDSQRMAAAQQMMAQLMLKKKRAGGVPGLSLAG